MKGVIASPLDTVSCCDGPVVTEQSSATLVQEGGRPPLPQRHLPRPLPVLGLLPVDDLPLPKELPPEPSFVSNSPSAPMILGMSETISNEKGTTN